MNAFPRTFRPLAYVASSLVAIAVTHATPIYSLSGQVYAGNLNTQSMQDTGTVAAPVAISDSIANSGWGAASYAASAGGGAISLTGAASATEVVGDGFGTSGLGGFDFTGTYVDSLTFHSGTGNPMAVKFSLSLDDTLWTSSPDDAKAQINARFFPAGNTYFFNSGLQAYDTIGTGFGPSNLLASGIYYIPDGVTINFGLALTVSANAHFGTDYSIPTNPTFATSLNLSAVTARAHLELLDGGSYESSSGTDYGVPAVSTVPEVTPTISLLGAGLALLVWRARPGRQFSGARVT